MKLKEKLTEGEEMSLTTKTEKSWLSESGNKQSYWSGEWLIVMTEKFRVLVAGTKQKY